MSKIKKPLALLLCALLILVLIACAYAAYVLLSYYRIEDDLRLEPTGGALLKSAAVGEEYTALTYNIGFCAYTPDFGFFMDGGDESRAFSKDAVLDTLNDVTDFLSEKDADILLLQEVDKNSTRSHGVDQDALIRSAVSGYDSVFAVNYDSPYLFYPFTEPHGKSLSGMLTFSTFEITDSIRKSLPIEESLMKLVDLDRCYSKSRVPVENEKELIVYNAHLSAYTSDGTIAEKQLEILAADMAEEYKKGNYIICGGDFNKDLYGDSSKYFGISGDYTWAKPFPVSYLEGTGISLVSSVDEDDPVPSCRNADGPYNKDQFVLTVDGFLVSDNIKVTSCNVVDTGFSWSDHNPVKLTFILSD